MLITLFAIFGAIGIAIIIFAIIVALGNRPVKALIVAHMVTYALIFVYIYILNRILKRKEDRRVVIQQE